ncbi:hypothetical protein ONZ45_g4080 [Pleurotus djamor]|nr:hypothetical protein ONZ45_g4080 [Pleurotus djamor]
MNQQQLLDLRLCKEIARHEASIVALKTSRNTYSAISQLPDELLAQIFLIVKNSPVVIRRRDFGDKYDGWIFSGERQWRVVLAVCSHWHQVAMNMPRLWSQITLSNAMVNRAMEMFKRSRDSPLTIEYFLQTASAARYHDGFWSASEKILGTVNRMQELRISFIIIVDETLIDRIFSFLKAPSAPLLEKLVLFSSSEFSELTKPFPWAAVPSLRVLQLRQMLIAPDFPPLPNLIELEVDFSCTSIAWLLAILQSAPNVEDLHIDRISSQLCDQAVALGTTVALPKLRKLRLNLDDFADSKLFAHLEFPSSATIFDITIYRCTTPVDTTYLKRLCSRIPQGNAPHSLKVMINEGPYFLISLCGVTSQVPHFTLCSPMTHLDCIEICSRLLPTQISTLDIRGLPSRSDCELWSDLIPHFENLTSLSLEMCDIAILRRLQPDRHDKLSNPRLDTISLVSYSFLHQGHAFIGDIVKLLEVRKRYGVPVNLLSLHDCEVSDDTVAEFRRFGTVVDMS